MTNIPNQNSMKRMRHGTSLHCLLAEDKTDKNTIQGEGRIILKIILCLLALDLLDYCKH